MSLEDFQLLDEKQFHKSNIRRDFLKVHHQQGAQLKQPE